MNYLFLRIWTDGENDERFLIFWCYEFSVLSILSILGAKYPPHLKQSYTFAELTLFLNMNSI